ncbi:conserved Plasmodium protein, unknown function [Babesia microti strain RI]|uniref:Uncharacterized protein n=1 Tax=Babesia microti (strain RI) TaxID=1133968 RepID=A0A0K3AUM7_BABMR|nr:conserved Plasmodium protein, unknown function [Babesia microti strain RI]CTQ41301.1 conserved Plasmodium protein, unknown function [Babesia microti strain RI]|eukprot:XP_012649312.1 conserved Plasmodium protein, unknown function [Babesia microti strain RI]
MGRHSNTPNAILNPALRFTVKFPPIPYGQALRYTHAIEKSSVESSRRHPCLLTWGKLVKCMRRYPHSSSNKCTAESMRHNQCLQNNEGWKEPTSMNSFKILDMFQMFYRGLGKKYKDRSINQHGAGTFTVFKPNS